MNTYEPDLPEPLHAKFFRSLKSLINVWIERTKCIREENRSKALEEALNSEFIPFSDETCTLIKGYTLGLEYFTSVRFRFWGAGLTTFDDYTTRITHIDESLWKGELEGKVITKEEAIALLEKQEVMRVITNTSNRYSVRRMKFKKAKEWETFLDWAGNAIVVRNQERKCHGTLLMILHHHIIHLEVEQKY